MTQVLAGSGDAEAVVEHRAQHGTFSPALEECHEIDGTITPGTPRKRKELTVEPMLLAATAIIVMVAATGLSRRIGVAAPLILVAVGAGLSYIPEAPEIRLEPEWILLIVLPPLLYGAAVNFPIIDFRRNLAPIVSLGVVLVIISALVIGLLLWWLMPELNLATAIALGAVISPTDAVSATSIAKRIGLPSRIVTVLEGESLVNDASALVLMRTAVGASAAAFSLPHTVGNFAYATFAAMAFGIAIGFLANALRSRLHDGALITAVSFAIPFFSYIPAEEIGASGVIAVVTTGLIVGHHSVRTQTIQMRFAEQTNWRTLQFLLENGVFLLMGYQLRGYVLDVIHDGYSPAVSIGLGLLAVLVLVILRLAFSFPLFGLLSRRSDAIAAGHRSLWARFSSWVVHGIMALRHREVGADWRHHIKRRRESDIAFHDRERLGWRPTAIIGWAGMRGVVTVAAAQALPDDGTVPYRSMLILIAFTAAVATLLLGGLTLPSLATMLGVREAADASGGHVNELLGELIDTGEAILDDPDLCQSNGTPFPTEVVAAMHRELREQLTVAQRRVSQAPQTKQLAELGELRAQVFHAEREALADARATSAYASSTLNTAEALLNTLEARTSDGEDMDSD